LKRRRLFKVMIRLGMIRIMIRAILGVPIILRAFSTIADA